MKIDALDTLIKAGDSRHGMLGRKYTAPNGRTYFDGDLINPIMDNLFDAIRAGAGKTWKATEGFRTGFANWFKGTLDNPEEIKPGQPRFIGR